MALAGRAALAQACQPDFGPAVVRVEQILFDHPAIEGASLQLRWKGGVALEQSFGAYGVFEQVPVASASKWLSAAVLMSVVDEGLVSLDDPVGEYLPEFGVGGMQTMTLGQCYSHTSGLPGEHGAIGNKRITLREAAAEIAATGLRPGVLPGTDFYYGGASMQVAAAAIEVATGQGWNELFKARVAQPLGMVGTNFDSQFNPFGSATNPRVAGGAVSTLRDYGRFVQMVLDGGVWNGKQVLSASSVGAMLADQTFGVPITYSPAMKYPGWCEITRYGIGNWREPTDLNDPPPMGPVHNSSPGGYGFTPWVDGARDLAGVFLVLYNNELIFLELREMQQLVREAIDAAGACCAADCDGSGGLDIDDFICFQTRFALGGSEGDCDGDGSLAIDDFICFQTLFAIGC